MNLWSQYIFDLIELRISSNTDNIFPIKIIDSNSDFIRQVITCFDNLFQKIARISEKFSLISFTSNMLAIRPTLTLLPCDRALEILMISRFCFALNLYLTQIPLLIVSAFNGFFFLFTHLINGSDFLEPSILSKNHSLVTIC